jgi:hypothetical protein
VVVVCIRVWLKRGMLKTGMFEGGFYEDKFVKEKYQTSDISTQSLIWTKWELIHTENEAFAAVRLGL